MRKLTLFAASFLTFSALAQSPCPQRNEPGVYTVQPGDDWSFIAREFDISVRELKEQNGYRDGDVLEPCTPLFIKKSPEKTRAKVAKQGGEVHKVRTGERISDIARTYGYTEERFREFNGLSDNEEVNIGAVLWNTHCNCADVRTANAEKPKSSNARDYASDFDDKERGLASKQEDARRDAQKSGLSKSFSKTTMSKEEGDMITEINLLRSDPKSYARFVEAWQKEHPQTNNKVVKELIDELRNTSRLGLLQPEECLYTTAKKHAKDQKGTARRAGVPQCRGRRGKFSGLHQLHPRSHDRDAHRRQQPRPQQPQKRVGCQLDHCGLPQGRKDWQAGQPLDTDVRAVTTSPSGGGAAACSLISRRCLSGVPKSQCFGGCADRCSSPSRLCAAMSGSFLRSRP
jgi:LysM repeat protein